MKVGDLTIAEVFSTEKRSYVYNIPKYQREYTWGEKEWDLLFNDVIENDPGYFIGSIICIDTSSGERDSDTVYEVIDGQQRITTLSLLLLAIYVKLSALKASFIEDEDLLSTYLNLKKELTTKTNGKVIPRLNPQIQHYNRDDYYSILKDYKMIDGFERKPYATRRKIYKAYDRFSNLLDEYLTERSNEEQYLVLFEVLKKFNQTKVVSIDVKSAKDAYMLFESLNNRGVPLSAIDLIKNMLIQQSDRDKKSDDVYDNWTEILGYLGEEYSVQERFFRQYYNAFRKELNEPFGSGSGKKRYPLGLIATKTTMLGIYEKMIKTNYQTFIDGILPKARIYSVITNNAKDENRITVLNEPLVDLERIQGAPSYALLMYLLDKKEILNLSYEQIADVVNYLVKFFVRRNITDVPNTRKLAAIFMDIIENISSQTGETVIATIKQTLKEKSSDDAYFEQKLRGPVYADNVDSTRFLLCYYENKFSTKEIYVDLWGRNDKDGKYIWTIEHVFPEGENIPQKWIDMIADGDKAKAEEIFDKYVHTFGNLTITGYNSNLSNLSFAEKKFRKDKNGKSVGYMNGLVLNKDIQNQDTWKESNITSRTDELVGFFMKEFGL